MQDGTYSALSDMYQIGILVTELSAWPEHSCDARLSQFVKRLLGKEYTAEAALQDMPDCVHESVQDQDL